MKYLITLIIVLAACDPTPPLCGTPTNIVQAGPCPVGWNEFINEVVLPDVLNASCGQDSTNGPGFTREEQPGYFKYTPTPTSTPASELVSCDVYWRWIEKTGYYEVVFSCVIVENFPELRQKRSHNESCVVFFQK